MAKKQSYFRIRRIISILFLLAVAAITSFYNNELWQPLPLSEFNTTETIEILNNLEVKGRAPKTGYTRDQFGHGWATHSDGCDTRNKILKRDLINTTENDKCQILTGTLNDPYTGEEIEFSRSINSSAIQIDHVVALSDAWQKGAQQLLPDQRKDLANDPLNLLAVDGPANQQKGDSDAASWLPSNRLFRCQYIDRQIRVKQKYNLWITEAEKTAMLKIINSCAPTQ